MSIARLYCEEGCPFGSQDQPPTCGQQPESCPINEMYHALSAVRRDAKSCMYCSLQRSDSKVIYPANFCGGCTRYCPACDAPKK